MLSASFREQSSLTQRKRMRGRGGDLSRDIQLSNLHAEIFFDHDETTFRLDDGKKKQLDPN
jgi:hypothetical protein